MELPRIVKLKYPVNQGTETINELRFERRLKARDFKGLSQEARMDEMLVLAGRLCAQPPSVIEELDAEDMLSVMEVIGDFLPGGLQTGRTL
jgi:hypothetical protein